MLKTKDIFTPGRFPTWTYVDDHLKEKVSQLNDALDDGSILVSISGPSKSGKTVFIEHSLGKDNLVQVTGAGINSVADLWFRVFDLIGTPVARQTINEDTESRAVKSSGGVEGGILVSKGKVDVGFEKQNSVKGSERVSHAVDYLQLLIKELSESDLIVFIDDFHYIPRSIQKELAQQIKEAIRNGVKIICASVPYHADDVIRSNPDLRGRIFSIDFDYWVPEILEKIALKGFLKAKIDIPTEMITRFCAESAGSPKLMQYLCLNTCYELDRREVSETQLTLVDDRPFLEKICRRTVLSTDYGSVVEKMIEGPKARGSDRKIHVTN